MLFFLYNEEMAGMSQKKNFLWCVTLFLFLRY